jgi:hypothetical protein
MGLFLRRFGMNAKPNYIGFKDEVIRQRLENIVKQSCGRITITDLLRAAVTEKLDEIESTKLVSIKIPIRAFSAPIDAPESKEDDS